MANSEVAADLELLVECIKCQLDNPAAIKQALITIASMCTSTVAAKDFLRESGNLKFLYSILTTTTYSEVKEAGMYTLGCAVENHVYAQRQLTTSSMFAYLHEVLTDDHNSVRQKQTACFLILCIVANNSSGQALVRKSNCLSALVQLFKTSFTGDVKQPRDSNENWFETMEGCIMKFWSSVSSAIAVCVNNPQNDENQRYCASLFPHAFKILQNHQENLDIIRPVSSLIGLTVANNVHNQERVLKCGGVENLSSILHRAVNRILQGPTYMHIAMCVLRSLDSIISDNVLNAERCGELGMVPLIVRLLQMDGQDTQAKLQLTITLAHCVEATCGNQVELVENGGMGVMIQALTESTDDELTATIKYILQTCVKVEKQAMLSKPTPQRERMIPVFDRAKRELGIRSRAHNVMPSLKKQPAEPNIGTDNHLKEKELNDNDIRKKLDVFEKKLEDSISSYRNRETDNQSDCLNKTGDTKEKLLETKLEQGMTQEKTQVETLRLQDELIKERALCCKFEKEASAARKALEERMRQEREATDKAQALMRELDQQCQLQQCHDNVKNKEEIRERGSNNLTREKEKMEELNEVDQKLESLKNCMEQKNDPNKAFEVKVPENNINKVATVSPSIRPKSTQEERISNSSIEQGPGLDMIVDSELNVSASIPTSSQPHLANAKQVQQYKSGKSIKKRQTQKGSHTQTVGIQTPLDIGFLSMYAAKKSQTESTVVSNSRVKASPAKIITKAQSKVSSVGVQTPGYSVRTFINFNHHEKNNTTQQDNSKGCGRELSSSSEKIKRSHTDMFVKPVGSVKVRKSLESGILQQTPSRFRVKPIDKLPRNSTSNNFKSPFNVKPTPRRFSLPNMTQRVVKASPCGSVQSMRSGFDLNLMKKAKERGFNLSSQPRVEWWLKNQKDAHDTRKPQNDDDTFQYTHKDISENINRGSSLSVCSEELKSDDSEEYFSSVSQNGDAKVRQRLGNTRCPGCQPPAYIGGPLLNSCTYNISLETSANTCSLHRYVRSEERRFVTSLRKDKNVIVNQKRRPLTELDQIGDQRVQNECEKGRDVYNFLSDDNSVDTNVTPPTIHNENDNFKIHHKITPKYGSRRPRVPYTKAEEGFLLDGVAKLGKFWNQILCTYNFHSSRTAVDLMDKYKRMAARREIKVSVRSPGVAFSMVEERRLKRGVHKYGYNWKAILDAYSFSRARTAQQLRNKWRSMHKSNK